MNLRLFSRLNIKVQRAELIPDRTVLPWFIYGHQYTFFTVYISKFATRISLQKSELFDFKISNSNFYRKIPSCVHFNNLQLEFLPQKSKLFAFQNLQLEFLQQKSELWAFQNLQLEFLPQKFEL